MDGPIPNQSSDQFSVVGWGCIPSLLFDLRLNYGGGNEDNGDLLALPHSVSLTLQQATAALYLHRRHSDPQRQVWLSLWSLLERIHKVLFEPSDHLCWVWCLILNMILPLLPPCWGFSFALGCGISLHGCSSTYNLARGHTLTYS